MATLCKNCGRPVKFDPASQRLTCDFCGSMFRPGELEEYDKDILENIEPSKVDSDDYMDSYVYSCSSCGGEVVVNGTEVSTTCIYCGSPSVAFSRIAKSKKPDLIIPFRVSKEEALQLVRERFGKGVLIPNEIKKFKVDDVRGIYIPYWLVNAKHRGSTVLRGTIEKFEGQVTTYCAKGGDMLIQDLPVEASSLFNDEMSSKLEPYNIKAVKPFDESYLLGFYSDTADISDDDLRRTVGAYGKKMFEDSARNSTTCTYPAHVIESYHDTQIEYSELSYAMFPAWFITYFHQGQFNTILVNGQTGKVVCGVPWNKRLFNIIYACGVTAISVTSFFFYKFLFTNLFEMKTSDDLSINLQLILVLFSFLALMFAGGWDMLQKTFKSLSLTQEASTFRFVKRRQG